MITIDAKTTMIVLVLVALFILLIFLIVLVKNLITTVKKANVVLDDAQNVTGIVSERSTELNGIVGDLSGAVSDVTNAMSGKKNLIGAVTNIGKAAASTASYYKQQRQDQSFEPRQRRRRG